MKYQMPPGYKHKKKKGLFPDNILIGFISGLLFALLGIVFLLFFWGSGDVQRYFSNFTDFESAVSMERSSKVISLSMIANLIPFYYFLNKKQYNCTRGIILAMFLWAVLIFLYKFVWQ